VQWAAMGRAGAGRGVRGTGQLGDRAAWAVGGRPVSRHEEIVLGRPSLPTTGRSWKRCPVLACTQTTHAGHADHTNTHRQGEGGARQDTSGRADGTKGTELGAGAGSTPSSPVHTFTVRELRASGHADCTYVGLLGLLPAATVGLGAVLAEGKEARARLGRHCSEHRERTNTQPWRCASESGQERRTHNSQERKVKAIAASQLVLVSPLWLGPVVYWMETRTLDVSNRYNGKRADGWHQPPCW
jgi:hypothetical protein